MRSRGGGGAKGVLSGAGRATLERECSINQPPCDEGADAAGAGRWLGDVAQELQAGVASLALGGLGPSPT